MKKAPFPAFILQAPYANGYTDSFSVRLCWVQSINKAAGTAEVVVREGNAPRRRTVAFSDLASDLHAAHAKMPALLSALLARSAQTAVPGATAGTATLSPAPEPAATMPAGADAASAG